MTSYSKEQVLASSRGWVASLLNFLPGLGAGYLYQRRWIPYFLTIGAVITWFFLGIILQGDKEVTQTEQIIGISGLFLISSVTVTEAYLTFKKAVKSVELSQKENKPEIKKGWFR